MIRELNDLQHQSDSVYVKSPLIREALALYAKYYINHKQYKASYVAASILIIPATAMSISFNMIWPMIIAWPFVAMLWLKGLLMYTNSQAPEQPSMSTDLNGSGGEFSTRTPSGTIAFLQIDGPNR
ncbi:hypothetical protein N9C31_03295 [Gammaproteobacteria bacterium]|nr:hypothetical protein [Gammaproteobacteria bacterium]